jgi:hypothetical protein
MIRNTQRVAPQLTLSAYKDNAAVVEAFMARRFAPDATGRMHWMRRVQRRLPSRWKPITTRRDLAVSRCGHR